MLDWTVHVRFGKHHITVCNFGSGFGLTVSGCVFVRKVYDKAHNTPSRLTDLKLTMYAGKAGQFPCLKGKAAQMRHLALPLMETCQEFLDDSTLQHRQVKKLISMAVRIETILDNNADEYVLPPMDADEYKKASYAFVQLNTALGQHFHPAHTLLFHFTIKFHDALHLAHCAQWMNPRVAWCYAGDDFMMKVKGVVQGSHRGTAPQMVSHTAMLKYCQGLGLRFHAAEWRV